MKKHIAEERERLATAPCGISPATQQQEKHNVVTEAPKVSEGTFVMAATDSGLGDKTQPATELSAKLENSKALSTILNKESSTKATELAFPKAAALLRSTEEKAKSAHETTTVATHVAKPAAARNRMSTRHQKRRKARKKLVGFRKKIHRRAHRLHGKRIPQVAVDVAANKELSQRRSRDKSDKRLNVKKRREIIPMRRPDEAKPHEDQLKVTRKLPQYVDQPQQFNHTSKQNSENDSSPSASSSLTRVGARKSQAQGGFLRKLRRYRRSRVRGTTEFPSDVMLVMRKIAQKRERKVKTRNLLRKRHERRKSYLREDATTAEELMEAAALHQDAKEAKISRKTGRKINGRKLHHRTSRRKHPFQKRVRRAMKKRRRVRKRQLQREDAVTEAAWKSDAPTQREASVGAFGRVGVRRQMPNGFPPGYPPNPRDEHRQLGPGVRRQKGEGSIVALDTIPTASGCYVRHPTDNGRCSSRVWTLDEWGKQKTDVDSWYSKKHCLARKEQHDNWCGGDSSEWFFVEPPEPTKPGCYVRQPTNGMCKSFSHWTPDTWGRGEIDSWNNKAACLGRKDLHDLLCGGDTSEWLFVESS
jgi:hypothetical protein